MRSVEQDVSLLLVSYGHAPDRLRRVVEQLRGEVAEAIIVDNAGDGSMAAAFAGMPEARLLHPEANLGYAAACNLAARHAQGRWLLFLNPDATPEPGLVRRLLAATDDDVAIAGAQVLLPDGAHVNAGDNPVHLSGLSWGGRYGAAPEAGPPRDVAACSGAALLVRAEDFERLDGYQPGYFMYHDDVDLAWRARLAARRVRFVPDARVRHDYAFEKGAYKWFWLERNRLWTVLSNYDRRTLVLLAPLLLATEAGTAVLAVRDGWWREKLRVWRRLWAERRELRAWRAHTQRLRRVSDGEILSAMTARLDTPLVAVPAPALLGALLEAYRRLLVRLVRG